eukprot:scpid17827/ scgid18535/ 
MLQDTALQIPPRNIEPMHWKLDRSIEQSSPQHLSPQPNYCHDSSRDNDIFSHGKDFVEVSPALAPPKPVAVCSVHMSAVVHMPADTSTLASTAVTKKLTKSFFQPLPADQAIAVL